MQLSREHLQALRGCVAYVEVETATENVPGKIQDALENMLGIAREAIDILNDEGNNAPFPQDPLLNILNEAIEREECLDVIDETEGADMISPESRPCQECGTEVIVTGYFVIDKKADPTQAYHLACGHDTIDL